MQTLRILLQWTWGLPQTLAGAILSLLLGGKKERFCEAVVTRWRAGGSMSLGLFLFLGTVRNEDEKQRILVHEYGHTIQSLITGPLYLPLVGLPSVLWANLPVFRRLRQKRRISYYAIYPENWANTLGARATGLPAPEQTKKEGTI